jgi:hypothetical protein
VFFNFNCVVLDVCEVHIGDYTLFGPGVQILTPLQPFDHRLRREREYGKPVRIGSDAGGRRRRADPCRRQHRRSIGDRRGQRRDA